jgi:hypothetical protein
MASAKSEREYAAEYLTGINGRVPTEEEVTRAIRKWKG